MFEGTPKVLYEAAGCGTPVIILNKISSPVVIDNYSGFIAEDNDDLFNKTKNLCSDMELGKKFSENIYQLSKNFRWSSVINEWEKAVVLIGK